MGFDKPSMMPVQKKDMRKLLALAESMRECDIPYECPDIEEQIAILKRILHLDVPHHMPED